MARRYSNIKWTKAGLRLLEEARDIWVAWHRTTRIKQSCPLCLKYFSETCSSCPIAQFTGMGRCRGTPYWGVNSSFDKETRAEINFLRRLVANGRKVLGVGLDHVDAILTKAKEGGAE